ncbi:NAC domain-containing protein [Trifolium repens]|nr:NAC domain-containing protein [Trifolium repens]
MTTTPFPILISDPVGFRFRPTDEELVNHYLKSKLLGNDDIAKGVIAEIDLCKFEPWDLPAVSMIKSDDQQWFFLCPLNYKHAKSKKIKRATEFGFWKATGKDRKITITGTNKVIGIKKTLVYYQGRVAGDAKKTNWVIHEYHDVTFQDNQRNFVLCRLKKKDEIETNAEEKAEIMICGEGEPSRNMSCNQNFEGDLPFSTQHSSISKNDQKLSTQNLQHQDAYFGNFNMVDQTWEYMSEDEFWSFNPDNFGFGINVATALYNNCFGSSDQINKG